MVTAMAKSPTPRSGMTCACSGAGHKTAGDAIEKTTTKKRPSKRDALRGFQMSAD
jgi:hypothetical protein